MDYWQMTWKEYECDSFVPVRKPMHLGAWEFDCPICNAPVGIYRTDEGLIYKRETCPNGHRVRWDRTNINGEE